MAKFTGNHQRASTLRLEPVNCDRPGTNVEASPRIFGWPEFWVQGCAGAPELRATQFFVCKKLSDWPSFKNICGKALTCAITLYTEASLAEAVFLLRRIGPVHNGYTRSAALVRQMTLVFRLTVQTATSSGDSGCIAAVIEMLVPALTQQQSVFVHQLVQEYGETGASAIKLENEILRTESGSRYVDVADKPSEVPSLEVTRKIMKDLRDWWARRSSKSGRVN
ncbi:hypothetical protein B0H14DRAFT_2564513 [Mycena olivaceomarginata]|nr:hypothetical protein B0H14DRAFT_2564513 [Mycena olivaceomarginata]